MVFHTVDEFKSNFTYDILEQVATEDLINTLNHLLALGGLQEGETYFEGVSKDMFGQSSKISKLLTDRGIGKKRNGNFYKKEETSLEVKLPNVSQVDLERIIEIKILEALELQKQKRNFLYLDEDIFSDETQKITIAIPKHLHSVVLEIQKKHKYANMTLIISQAIKEFAVNHNFMIEEVEAEQEEEQ